MSIENPITATTTDSEIKTMNGLNGVSNGHSVVSSASSETKEKTKSSSGGGGGSGSGSHHHKSSSKDKHRDKDREHKSSKSGHSHSSSSKDKHHSSSSSSHRHDKEKSSSDKHKSSHSDKDKEKDKDKDKHKSSSSSSKHHSSSSSGKDKHRDKDREHKSSKSGHSHSSSSKDKHHSSTGSGSHHHKDKDKDKDKSSSTTEKDKEKSSSDKHRSSSSKHHHSSSSSGKDKHRDKDRDREHKDKNHKEHHSSSSKEHKSSHRDKDKHHSSSKSSSSHDRHKERESKKSLENGVADQQKQQLHQQQQEQPQIKVNEPDVVEVKEELRDPLDTSNYSFSESNAIQANGIRECFVNVSQISNSSCDYSMSQFRPDESAFSIKGTTGGIRFDDDSRDIGDYDQGDNGNGDDAGDEDYNDNNGDDSDEDMPIAKRKKIKREISDDDDDEDLPLTARKKPKTEVKKPKKIKREPSDDDEDEDDYDKPKKKKIKKEKKMKEEVKVKTETASPQKGRKKKEENSQEVWKWWEEEKPQDGTKWRFLEHKGPVFAPDYDPLPSNVIFEYDGQPMKLSQDAEEVAGFYARMLEHDYTSKDIFNTNFFKDWRKSMTSKEKEKITKLEKCNFRKMHAYFTNLSERNKNRTKEEKLALKQENENLLNEYGFCTIDGHKEKIGNFKIEPPGLFRGRGEHPKMGLVKRRIMPEDVMINCSKDSKIPVPPKGHRWKEVRHDNTVTWLASWTENVQGQVKYVMLNPSSKLKGEKDWQKYETARRLHKHIEKIRSTYREEWKSKEMRIRQRAVALYFIDKLALRAGNEKDEDQADTVGCCSLRVEHIELHKELNGRENVVVFDFLGKDSIRYYNEVEVEKRVFKNLELFKENKKDGDDLFDRLNTVVMNEHLRDLMDGLTAKVFRTYNASWTLQNQLKEMTDPDASVPEKLLAYNRANRAVAILCNHQRAVPKGHQKSMENLKEKIRAKREQIDDLEVDVKHCVKAAKKGSVKEKVIADKKKKQLEKLKEQLKKLELQETDRDENKTIALGTSKLNYLDPRISVAWCKKHGVPIEKIYNKTQRDKFRWAIDMADEDYEF